MLMEVKNNFRYFIDAIKVSIKSAMAYKVSFIIQTIFMFINNAFFLVFWGVVFSKADGDIGITFQNVLYLWSFSTISFGITYFIFGGVSKINDYIISGALDSYLLQPKNVLINVATSKSSFSACGDILFGIVIGFIATGGDIGKMIILLLLAIFGTIFYFSCEVILRSLAVWIGDTNMIADRYMQTLLVTFASYPENIFKTGVKIVLYTVVPAAYLSFMPSSIMESFDIQKVLIVLAIGLLYLFIAIKVFYKALESYESGNNMSMKD